MARGEVDLVVTGADRIAANGDTANKIGTYGLAVLARHHGVPFYVAAPSSTIDPSLPSGREIPSRSATPARCGGWGGQPTAPEASPVYNPAFDVTPAAALPPPPPRGGRPPRLVRLRDQCFAGMIDGPLWSAGRISSRMCTMGASVLFCAVCVTSPDSKKKSPGP